MMRNISVLVMASLFLSTGLFAAEITKIKGNNALVDLKGESAVPGDVFYSIGSDGKRHGIIQITKVKGDKAIGKLNKGKIDVGQTLEHKNAEASPAKNRRKGSKAESETAASRSYWGGMAGYAMDSMSVKVPDNRTGHSGETFGTAPMTGSSFSAMGFFDYEMFPQIWFRGLAGLEGFSATGGSICGINNSSSCNASIYYISMDFMARYVFMQQNFRPWLGGGVALMFPAAKKSSALDSSSISNTSVIQVAGGFDWFFNKDMFVPVSLEYGLLPKSNEVDATWIELRVGLGIPF